MKDGTSDVAIKESVGLKPKMYSFFLDNSEHKKAKDILTTKYISKRMDMMDRLLVIRVNYITTVILITI